MDGWSFSSAEVLVQMSAVAKLMIVVEGHGVREEGRLRNECEPQEPVQWIVERQKTLSQEKDQDAGQDLKLIG